MSIHLSLGIEIYCIFLAIVIGSVLGSFLNCVAYRIAHGEVFLKGRSHCPKCHHVLGPFDLIPIVSWVMHKGKCAYCKEPVSIRYPLTELFMATMSVLCLLKFDLTLECLRNYILLCCLFTLSLVDLDIFEIPDSCIIIPIIAWYACAFFTHESILTHTLALFLYGGGILLISMIMDKILKKESMGGGDIKLFGVMGLYLGLVGGMFSLLIACIIGIILSFVSKKDEEKHFPFGPSISLALWFVLLYGQPLIQWYLNLM